MTLLMFICFIMQKFNLEGNNQEINELLIYVKHNTQMIDLVLQKTKTAMHKSKHKIEYTSLINLYGKTKMSLQTAKTLFSYKGEKKSLVLRRKYRLFH